MNVKLFFSAVIKFFIGVLLVGMLVFLPAGTLSFINGWILMTILFVPMLIAGVVMMIVISLFNYKWLLKLYWFMYIGNIVLLVLMSFKVS